jgi:arginyl-tRNA--protein-N-Asp/Glu arginylyltransferase
MGLSLERKHFDPCSTFLRLRTNPQRKSLCLRAFVVNNCGAEMKLLFSEHKCDYDHYQFPYAIWAVPDSGEAPADIFDAGFLPSSRNLDRFYLCRHVRVELARYKSSSENRRILRKGEGLDVKLVPRAKFNYTPERRLFFKTYADIKFGKDVMSFERLDSLFESPIISHLLVFTDQQTGAEVGAVTLYLEDKKLAYYYYAFYDLNYYRRNLGMFMMTSAVGLFAERGFRHLYLGTCYSQNALYKTQFSGAEFFNGFRWSADLKELKYLLRRDKQDSNHHLLETEEYRDEFYKGALEKIVQAGGFEVKSKN